MHSLAFTVTMLSACNNSNDAAEDKLERDAEVQATAAGPAEVALGLSEAQLLEADLVGADGRELGDIVQVVRGADGKVDRLLVEIEGPGPDRFVHVPIADLKSVVRGTDTDLSTTMTKEQLAALPEVKITAP